MPCGLQVRYAGSIYVQTFREKKLLRTSIVQYMLYCQYLSFDQITLGHISSVAKYREYNRVAPEFRRQKINGTSNRRDSHDGTTALVGWANGDGILGAQ